MRKRKNLVDRLLSMVLALLLAFNILPATAYAANTPESPSNSEPTNYTITVKEPTNESGVQSAVEGATVKYTIKVDETAREEKTVTTDENGIAVLDDMADTEVSTALTDGKKVTLTYEVSKEGYNTAVSDTDVEITSVTGNLDVQLSKKEQSTITATISDSSNKKSAVVKVNESDITLTDGKGSISVDKGSKVTISVTPVNEEGKNNVYIKSLSISGVEKTIDENSKYGYSEEIDVNDDLDIKVELGTQYTITVTGLDSDSTKGTVSLDGTVVKEGSNTKVVEAGTSVRLSVIPNDRYQIISVNVAGNEEKITDRTAEYTKDIKVNSDCDINVSLEELYKVTIEYNKNGTIETDPESKECEAGKVLSIVKDGKVTIKATPNNGYRVETVKKNNKSIVPEENQKETENGYSFEDEIDKVDKNYKYEITFAPNNYKISVKSNESNDEEAYFIDDSGKKTTIVEKEYSETTKVYIKPKNGYRLSGLTCDDKFINIGEYHDEDENNSAYYDIAINGEVSGNENGIGKIEAKFEKINNQNSIFNFADLTYSGLTLSKTSDDKIEAYFSKNAGVEPGLTIKSKTNEYDQIRYCVKDKNGNDSWTKWQSWSSDLSINISNNSEIYFQFRTSNKHNEIGEKEYVSAIIDSTVEDVILETKQEPNTNKYYNSDVDVNFSAKDSLTGINSISYRIVSDVNSDTEYTNVYSSEDSKVKSDDVDITKKETSSRKADNGKEVVTEVYGTVHVKADKCNTENTFVQIKVIDNAGNENEIDKNRSTYKLHINSKAPTASIVFEDNVEPKIVKGSAYYGKADSDKNAVRKATITITDRADTFDKENAKAGIEIKTSKSGDASNGLYEISEFEAVEGAENEFRATITFKGDAKYEWSIKYTNKADKEFNSTNAKVGGVTVDEKTQYPYSFTLDNTAPTGKMIVDGKVKDEWNKIIDTVTFGIFSNNEINVEAKTDDITSGVSECTYFVDTFSKDENEENYEHKTVDELKDCTFTKEKVSISEDEAFLVYAKIVDKAGNTTYISSNGIIEDTTVPIVESIKPTTEANNYGYYNSDVDVDFSVKDSLAGIKSISYRIVSDINSDTEYTNVYSFEDSKVKSDNVDINKEKTSSKKADNDKNLVTEVYGTVHVKADKCNTENTFVQIKVIDNAGNVNVIDESNSTCKLHINSKAPTATIEFVDNVDPNVVDGNAYYGKGNAVRKAIITISDRDDTFLKDNAKGGISVVGEKLEPDSKLLVADMLTDFSKDGDVYKAELTFTQDAVYEWSIKYTNKAGLSFVGTSSENSGVTIKDEDNKYPYKFILDNTKPTGTITINQNTWSKLLNTITFGLWGKEELDVTATSDDITSPTEIYYYKSNADEALSSTNLDAIFADKSKYKDNPADVKIGKNEQATIYTKVIDYAGNYIYLSSDGHIVDDKASMITLTPDSPNKNGVYNKDVNVGIKVTDSDVYSGIQSVTYRVLSDGKETQADTLYSFEYTRDDNENSNGGKLTIIDKSATEEKVTKEGVVPTKADLKNEWSGNIVVDSKANNSSNVVVEITAIDNAGNSNTQKIDLDIDVTNPDISVSYDNNTDNGGNTYFNANRTATLSIRERTNHFDADAATKGIKITAVDLKGKSVLTDEQIRSMISGWTTTEGEKPDDAVHTATISYTADANYTFKIACTDKAAYTDMAGNDNNEPINTGNSVAPYEFTVDKNAPTGIVTSKTAEGRTDKWDTLVGKLTFGIWSGKQIDVSAVTDDETSPVASVEYYKTADTTAKTVADLSNVTEWKDFNSMSFKSDEQFTVYLKIVDMAGNTTYISTNGLIVDSTDPRIDGIAPQVTITPEQPINGIYNRDVNVAINVQDVLSGGTYSGLKTVSYRVLNLGQETQSGVLYAFENAAPTQSELKKNWTGSITVDSSKNNSNDVVIEVYAEDNAKNSTSKTETIKIDITKPQINISYDNNNPDSEKYYKDSRTATIVVTERNFDPKDVKVNITNTDGTIPSISGWTTSGGSGNLDDTTHTATITYDVDGDYTFDIDYTDEADNHCDGKTFSAGTANETEFTIDKTIPTISVSYNNNASANGKYFNASRVATVTINEHNFDASRVQFTQTASLNGSPIAAPSPSWSNNGDVHTATFSYDTDGDYTFDVTMTDMAGNQNNGVSYSSETDKDFTVDTNIEKPVISGVENGKAYKGEVVPTIDFSDINYSDYSVSLTRTRMDEKNVDVTADFIKEMNISAQGGSGTNNTFDIIQDNDGIYTLTVKVMDLAGNEAEESVTFTLNRFGSVYAYDDYLSSLIKDGGAYVQSIDKDIEITEYNADRLVNGSLRIEITKDGKPIENAEYTVSPEINDQVAVGESGWFQYGYDIAASNFKEDGVYKMTVSSEDATGNTPENTNYADKAILFRVDSTAPEISSISGLENSVIDATDVNVKYTVYDTIGLASVKVYVDGKQKDEITDFSSDANNYSGTFDIAEKSDAQAVRLVVEDLAGNITDTDSDSFKSAYAFNRLVTISTNIFVRWFANKTLFYGSLGCVAVVVLGTTGGIILVKRRKNKASAKAE